MSAYAYAGSADGIFKNFTKKTGFEISCILSP